MRFTPAAACTVAAKKRLRLWAALLRNHRPVAFPTPPPLPRLGVEVTAQQEQKNTERGDADDPKNWISYVEHSQNFNRYCAESCTFNPDGKSGAAPTGDTVFRPFLRDRSSACLPCGTITPSRYESEPEA